MRTLRVPFISRKLRYYKQLQLIAKTVVIVENMKHQEIIGPLTFEDWYIISVFGGHSAMDIPAGYVRVIPPERT